MSRRVQRDLIAVPIDKGVPIPPDGECFRRRYTYPWADLQIGDSFLMPDASSGSAQAYTRGLRDGRTYTTRLVEGGLRVWRTA